MFILRHKHQKPNKGAHEQIPADFLLCAPSLLVGKDEQPRPGCCVPVGESVAVLGYSIVPYVQLVIEQILCRH